MNNHAASIKLFMPLFQIQNSGCPAFSGNKIKHVSETKADTNFCASSFSVVTLPAFLLGQGHHLGS